MTSKSSEPPRTFWTGPVKDPTRFRVDGVSGELLEYARGGEGLVFYATRNDVASESRDCAIALKLLANVSMADYSRIHDRCLAISETVHPSVMRQEETFIGSALWSDAPPREDDFDLIYCVARWIEGRSLREAIEDASATQKLKWVCQVARAVQYLHDYRSALAPKGIIHRDIKPSNIRIGADGRAVLIDFGMSRPNHGSDLTAGAGTFLWMAPEVIGELPKAGPGSDVWGVGAVAHWMIMGTPPRFEDSTSVRRERISERCRASGFHSSRNLSRQIASLLEASPHDRPTDLQEWAVSVERVIGRMAQREHSRGRLRRLAFTPLRITVLTMSLLGLVAGGWAFAAVAGHHPNPNLKTREESSVRYYAYDVVIPGSTKGEVSDYNGPSSRDHVTGSLKDGAAINIACQTSGSEVGYPQYTVVWDRLRSGYYVSDFFANTPTPYNYSDNIPRCSP